MPKDSPLPSKEEMRKEHAASAGKLAECIFLILEEIGNRISIREGYKDLDGIEAVHLFLCNKHHWQPATVRSMNFEDLHFLVQQEKFGKSR